jgi:hypothetical protein
MLLRTATTMMTNDQIALIAGAIVVGPVIAIVLYMWYRELKEWIDKR